MLKYIKSMLKSIFNPMSNICDAVYNKELRAFPSGTFFKEGEVLMHNCINAIKWFMKKAKVTKEMVKTQSLASLFRTFRLGYVLNKFFGGSPVRALIKAGMDIELWDSKRLPCGIWDIEANCVNFMNKVAKVKLVTKLSTWLTSSMDKVYSKLISTFSYFAKLVDVVQDKLKFARFAKSVLVLG